MWIRPWKTMHSDPTENLRQTMHSIIMSTEDFDDAGHKLLNIIRHNPDEEKALCIMLLMCCSDDRTYLPYYGLIGQRICMKNMSLKQNFEALFVQHYSRVHQLFEEKNLSNEAKFFAHLFAVDAISWHVLSYVRLSEEETTDSSRFFLQILFQELFEQLGARHLNQRLMQMQDSSGSVIPKDDPKNTRFAVDFFVSIGLGGIIGSLVDDLKTNEQQEAARASFDHGGGEIDEEERKKKKQRRT